MKQTNRPTSVPADPEQWSAKSKQSVAYGFIREYTDKPYNCWHCQAECVFTAANAADQCLPSLPRMCTSGLVFFAHRTRQRILIALVACIAYGLLAAATAAIFPRDGKTFVSSFGWWLLAIPVGLVAYAALELFGTWGLGPSFWQHMPSWARVLLLVAVISLGAVGAVFVSQYIGGAIAL